MRIAILGSGSSGNSVFVEENNFRFLVDAGFSGKEIEKRLNKLGVAPDTIGAILITHEHSDHIKGAGIFSRKYNIPIYMAKKSYDYSAKKLGKLSDENLNFIIDNFIIDSEILIKPFKVMHDAVNTLGFSINFGQKKVAIATDIGYATNIVSENFKDSDAIIIESNYDYEMLMNGPYPWDLKNRVKGRNGHLSNMDTAKFINKIYSKKLKKVYLAHISKDNNTHKKAKETLFNYLKDNDIKIDIEVAHQDRVSTIFEI
ncbi:MBL fold metallo-hydrolase [Haliovirga abyssi]|uniref:Hydrolase n=1 Tax=Haliovirga abyssi TaxID=2996794 RepID=A0AAU9D3L5_9FUSO|nr:MBL fold metallo-hydrolase [Haliovirga abyssi]BDU50569.1 hydrolase [Haliovirga abyssi]